MAISSCLYVLGFSLRPAGALSGNRMGSLLIIVNIINLFILLQLEFICCQTPAPNIGGLIDSNSSMKSSPPNISTNPPSNHRMNPEEVPRLTTETSANRTAYQSAAEELPFNVDFVDQPDQFEMGQSFFMPTRRIPSKLYRPVGVTVSTSSSSNNNNIAPLAEVQDENHRWSVAYDETNSTNNSNEQNATNQRLDNNPQTTTTSVPTLLTVRFDDDDSSENRYLHTTTITTTTTLAPPSGILSSLPVNQSLLSPDLMVNEGAAAMAAAAQLRQQVETELNKSLEEQAKLIKLLARRIDGSSSSASSRAVERSGNLAYHRERHSAGAADPLFKQTNTFLRAHVPKNHVVKHPKYHHKNPTRSTGYNRLPHNIQQATNSVAFSKPELSSSSGPGDGFVPSNGDGLSSVPVPVSVVSGHSGLANRLVGSAGSDSLGFRQFREDDVDLKQGLAQATNAQQQETFQDLSKSLQGFHGVQRAKDDEFWRALNMGEFMPKLEYAAGLPSKSRHFEGARLKQPNGQMRPKPASSSITKIDHDSETNEDESDHLGVPPRWIDWANIGLDEQQANDDEDTIDKPPLPTRSYDATRDRTAGDMAKLNSIAYEPYQQPIFTKSVMDSAAREEGVPVVVGGRRRKSNQMRGYYQHPASPAMFFDAPPPPKLAANYNYNHNRYPAPSGLSASISMHPRHHHHFQPNNDRQLYELSTSITPSASHKIIHIHTKEKKGHGKYLWPIMGGGLVMLMGFLIISNMLLSIPLLAMGASSLFNQGGFQSQQLVPVYNLSQLARPPTGRRRRRRWVSGQTRLAELREDFNFNTMLRRLMAKFAISNNRCRATNLLSSPPLPPAG